MVTTHERTFIATATRHSFAAYGVACCRRARMRRPCPGFTYIGMLSLVAAMGVGLTVVSQMWMTAQKRDKEEELLFVGDQFRRAFAMYNANGAATPRQLEDLLKDPRLPDTRRYLRRIYRDPITGRAEWGLMRSAGDTIMGVYSLSEEEPLKKTEFNLVDQAFEGKTKYLEWTFFPRSRRLAGGPATGPGGGTSPAGKPLAQPGIPQLQPDGIQAPQPAITDTQSPILQTQPSSSQIQPGTPSQRQAAPGVTDPSARQ